MTFHLYILYSESSDIFYVGQSSNIQLRLIWHNQLGQNTFTSKHRPWKIMCTIPFNKKAHALKAEKYLKKKSSEFKLRCISDNDLRAYIQNTFSHTYSAPAVLRD